MAGRNIEDKIRCSFCGKSQEQVRKMIAGPNGAFICDECVEVCTEIIEEEFEEEENVQHIRASVTKQLGEELTAKTTFIHLRGGIDYGKLNMLHRTMMRMLYSQIKKKPVDQLSEEDQELIATYGKKVDFTDLSSVEKIQALLK